MRRRVSVRPTKISSMMSLIMGCIFCFIGFFIVIPQFGMFGIFWTLIAVSITASAVYNVFSNKGLATTHIDIEDYEDEKSESNLIEERLRKLNELYEKRLITQDEFEAKKADLLEKL